MIGHVALELQEYFSHLDGVHIVCYISLLIRLNDPRLVCPFPMHGLCQSYEVFLKREGTSFILNMLSYELVTQTESRCNLTLTFHYLPNKFPIVAAITDQM